MKLWAFEWICIWYGNLNGYCWTSCWAWPFSISKILAPLLRSHLFFSLQFAIIATKEWYGGDKPVPSSSHPDGWAMEGVQCLHAIGNRGLEDKTKALQSKKVTSKLGKWRRRGELGGEIKALPILCLQDN